MFRQILGRLAKSRISRRLASRKERGKRLEEKGFVIEARSLVYCADIYTVTQACNINRKLFSLSFTKIAFRSKINS